MELTQAEWTSRAAAFKAEITARADEIEQGRVLPQDLADKLAGAGLYKLLVPKTYNGYEVHPCTFLNVIDEVAQADGSAAWCLNICNTSGLVAAYLPPQHAQEIYGPDTAITGGVFAPMGKATSDGKSYTVNGTWNWGSGTSNCTWIMAGCMIMDDDGKPEKMASGAPLSRMMLLPRSEIDIADTWHVTGLAGTGSNEFSIQNKQVPIDRSVALAIDKPLRDAPLYTFPSFGLLAIGIAAVAVGIAKGAADEFIALAGAKTPQFSAKSLANKSQTQTDFATAMGLIEGGRAFLHDAVAQGYDNAAASGVLSDSDRARIRLAATTATKNAAQAVTLLYTAAGGTSVYLATPLQRRFRDVHVATQHIMVASGTLELTGRVLLGVKTDTAML
ncbi:MAG: acyl-CoA dehydrogenase family protein [Alphaproteobacteria bacterium]